MAWLSPCKYGRRCLQSGLDSTASCYKCVESGEIKRQSVGGHNECFKNYVSVEKLKLPFSTDEIFLCKECVISVAVDNNAISVLTKEMELHNTSEYIHPKVVVSDQSYTSDDKQPAVGQSDSHTLSERGISAIPIPNKFTNANSSTCGVQPDQTILKSGFNATVTTKSLDVLKDGGQIDDETINFFCGMVTDRVTDTKIQMCSTFLVPKFMASTNMEEKQKCMKKYCKIENPDSMLVPFYVRNHWTIGYINFRTKKIEHYDHCFGIYRPDNFQPIAILVEMCDTLHILTQDWDISEKTEEEINKQEGTTDCGIHVCMDVLHLLQTDKSFQVRNCSIDTFRTRMCKEIAEWEESIPSEVKSVGKLSLFCHQNSDLRSLPNIGNTCHFTVACWSFCSHLTLESVQKHLVDYDNDRNSVRNSLLNILKHLMTGAGPESSESNIYDTNLRQNIGRVLLDMYPLEPNGQHDAGETFNKLMGILNLPGLKLRKKVTCDMHSQSTMYQKSEEYSSMNLYMPQGNLKNILFQDLVDQQQNASNPKWRCPNNNTGDCKSSSIQFITGPPAPVLTFVIVRNLPDNYLSTTNVEVPRIFNVVVHNPAQEEELEVEPKYYRQEVSYRVDSVVVHTFNSEQENGADQDQEYSILNPGHGHYMVCKHRRTTSSKDEFLLCDDLKYPDLYPVEDDYIFQNGKNIVLVTAVLVSKFEFHTDTDSEDVPTSEIESDFEDSEKKSSKIISSSTGIKLNRKTTDDMQELKVVTDSEVQPVDNGNPTKRSDADTVRRDLKITLLKSFEVNVTSLIHLESEVLFRQFTHFFQNNVDKIRTIPGLITESSSYEQRMDELKTNPLQFIHCFGIHALRNLWNLQQIAIYKLVTDTLIELVVQDPTNKVRDSSTRALLRTCINIGNSCSCVSGSSPCEYVYNPLYPADLFLNGIQDFKSFSNQGNWDPMYYTELFCSSDNTMFLVGPSVDPTTFICPSRFLAAVILQEIIFNNYFKIQDGHLLSKREVSGNSFESISLKFPENMVPFDLQELRNTWKSLESEASKLTRAASSTTVVETDVSTVWKIFTTIMSVLPVKGRSSMGFVDLTNGRRGALLANMMLGTPCIGVERNREVFNESVKLIKQAANIKKNLKIFMVNANYSTIKDFEGILGCCMYIGNGSLYLSSDYSETIPRIFAAKSMMFYYDCKTTTKIFFQKVTDTEVQKKWYMTIIRQCKQESNQHNVFLWMKKMKYWENNLVNPSENVKHWLEQAESGAVSSSATVEKDSTSSLAVSNSMSPSILGKTLFFSPERPRRLSHPKPNIDQLVESQPSKIRKPNFLIKRSKKIKIAKSSTTKRSKDNNEHFKSNSISLPEPTKKIILPKIQDEGKKTSASGSISIPVSTEKSVQEKNFSNFDVQKLEKYVDSAFEKHLNFGALQQILTGQIEKIENAVLKKLTEDAKKQTENLVLKKIDESTITNQINIRTSVEEMKQYVKKSEHKKGEQFFKAAFETVTSIATSNLNHSVKSPHSPTRNSHSHDRRKRHRQSRSDSECSRSNSERRRPPTSKKHKRKKNKYSSSESTSPRKNHRSETRGRGRSRSRSASNSRNRSQRRFRSSTNDSRSSYHSAGSPSLRRDVQVDVGAWSLLEVCQFLSSKNFPISVRDAFKSAQIHGRLLKEINEEYVNNVIRVQNGLELFNSNQVPSIVEVIHEICRSGRK